MISKRVTKRQAGGGSLPAGIENCKAYSSRYLSAAARSDGWVFGYDYLGVPIAHSFPEGVADIVGTALYLFVLDRAGSCHSISRWHPSFREDIEGWANIVSLSAGWTTYQSEAFFVGADADGNCYAVGNNDYGQCDVSGWTDIVQVDAGPTYSLGLKANGTCVFAGGMSKAYLPIDVSGWTDIVQVAAGQTYALGLKADGTIAAAGTMPYADVYEWSGVVKVAINGGVTALALTASGELLTTSSFYSWVLNNWQVSEAADVFLRDANFVVLLADGTCRANGWGTSSSPCCDVMDGWNLLLDPNSSEIVCNTSMMYQQDTATITKSIESLLFNDYYKNGATPTLSIVATTNLSPEIISSISVNPPDITVSHSSLDEIIELAEDGEFPFFSYTVEDSEGRVGTGKVLTGTYDTCGCGCGCG